MMFTVYTRIINNKQSNLCSHHTNARQGRDVRWLYRCCPWLVTFSIMLDGTDGRTPDRCFTSIPEERNSTRTLGPDPTTFEVCRVQPISGPDQVVKMKSSVTEWESSRGRISQPSLKFVCDQRPAPDSLQHYLDSLTGFLGRWRKRRWKKGKTQRVWGQGMWGELGLDRVWRKIDAPGVYRYRHGQGKQCYDK